MTSELKYSKDHEWLRLNGDGTAIIGITNYAQDQLGDVVYVELPEVGKQLNKDDDAAVVESVKVASDVKSPVSCTVIEINEQLSDEPEKVNTAPTEEGWLLIVKLDNPDELEQLMDEEAYQAYVT